MLESVAFPIEVPLKADTVCGPHVRSGVEEGILFPLSGTHAQPEWGRVYFDELDAIRTCRGEVGPYREAESGFDTDTTGWPWVYEVEPSSWLAERHAYEYNQYKYPLDQDFVHYLFRFHDEFVEAIARGIWIEKVDADAKWKSPLSLDHPKRSLDESSLRTPGVEFGIRYELRQNRRPFELIMNRARLCTQIMLEYWLEHDGKMSLAWSLYVRQYHHGRILAHFGHDWFFRRGMHRFDHVPGLNELSRLWSEHLREIAEGPARAKQQH